VEIARAVRVAAEPASISGKKELTVQHTFGYTDICKDVDWMERSLELLKAFADPARLRLLHLLAHRGPEICVCDLAEVLQMPQSTISRQMSPLRLLGLVRGRRAGLWVYYSLADPADAFHAALLAGLRHCAGEGGALEADLPRFDALRKKRALACCRPLRAALMKSGGKKK
jgi:ArsR family transcriptional regulator